MSSLFYCKTNKYKKTLVLTFMKNLLCVNVSSCVLSTDILLLNTDYSPTRYVVSKIVKDLRFLPSCKFNNVTCWILIGDTGFLLQRIRTLLPTAMAAPEPERLLYLSEPLFPQGGKKAVT